jgi:hypothetical protein
MVAPGPAIIVERMQQLVLQPEDVHDRQGWSAATVVWRDPRRDNRATVLDGTTSSMAALRVRYYGCGT